MGGPRVAEGQGRPLTQGSSLKPLQCTAGVKQGRRGGAETEMEQQSEKSSERIQEKWSHRGKEIKEGETR